MNKVIKKQREIHDKCTPEHFTIKECVHYIDADGRACLKFFQTGAVRIIYDDDCKAELTNTYKAIVAAMDQRKVMLDLVEALDGYGSPYIEDNFNKEAAVAYDAVIAAMEEG